ncbi:transcription factor HES-1-like [Anser cygnoides]|uniref:transcription factor HES-1-like n=1 Tax=Anser cygnoides TaxID=8845 RepID=UPI0034D17007
MSSTAPPPAARKLPKPQVEQRRRARLNHSLERLRLLLLAATRDQRLRNPKAEKAEILQKTVQFLRAQPQADSLGTEELFLRHYRSGYRECLARAARFLQAAAAAESPPTGPGTPSSLSPPAADTPGPPSRHGPSAPWAQPGCRGYGPSHHCQGPAPRPSAGPTPTPDCASCHGNSTGCLGDPSCCPSNGAGCHGNSSRCPSYNGYRPGFGPSLRPSMGPTPRPDCAGCHGNSTGCLGEPPCCPGNGVGCHGDSSRCPSYHGYGPSFRPSLRPSSGPTFGPSLWPHHSPIGGPVDPIGGPVSGPVGSPEDSWRPSTKEGQGASAGGLPGPCHVWRPWP